MKKLRGSIFFKLVLILVGAGFMVNLVVGFAFRRFRFSPDNQYLRNNAERYLSYLVKEFGEPPQKVRAENSLKPLGLSVRFEAESGSWATRKDIPTVGALSKMRTWQSKSGLAHHRGSFYKVIKTPAGSFIFSGTHKVFLRYDTAVIIFLLAALTLILVTTWWLIRRMLSPIRSLKQGVDDFGDNLEVQLPVRSRDELGDLTDAFNDMTDRIGKMIRDKDQLLLDVSHEIRTPLTRMKLALEMLADSSQRKSLEADVAEMQTMITEILESHRLDSQHGKNGKEPLDLKKLVSERVADYDRVKLHDSPDNLIVKADGERIRILVGNLLENALKYSEKPVDVHLTEKEGQASLKVTDYGVGIEEKELPRLFEPFYRTDRARSRETGGYGLGLSLCKKIVEYHEGHISVSSEPGQGATFEVIFPLFVKS